SRRWLCSSLLRPRSDVIFGGSVDCGAAFGGTDVAAGVADADAVGAELGEGFGDSGFLADAVDDEVPFLGGEFFGDAEANAARTTGDESYFGHGEEELGINHKGTETRRKAF